MSSPQFEAQRRAAQANLDKAGQALTEAEHLINERRAVLAAAKSDFERGQELVGKQIITGTVEPTSILPPIGRTPRHLT